MRVTRSASRAKAAAGDGDRSAPKLPKPRVAARPAGVQKAKGKASSQVASYPRPPWLWFLQEQMAYVVQYAVERDAQRPLALLRTSGQFCTCGRPVWLVRTTSGVRSGTMGQCVGAILLMLLTFAGR